MKIAEKNEFLLVRTLELVDELTAQEPVFEVRTLADMGRCVDIGDRIVNRATAQARRELCAIQGAE